MSFLDTFAFDFIRRSMRRIHSHKHMHTVARIRKSGTAAANDIAYYKSIDTLTHKYEMRAICALNCVSFTTPCTTNDNNNNSCRCQSLNVECCIRRRRRRSGELSPAHEFQWQFKNYGDGSDGGGGERDSKFNLQLFF